MKKYQMKNLVLKMLVPLAAVVIIVTIYYFNFRFSSEIKDISYEQKIHRFPHLLRKPKRNQTEKRLPNRSRALQTTSLQIFLAINLAQLQLNVHIRDAIIILLLPGTQTVALLIPIVVWSVINI